MQFTWFKRLLFVLVPIACYTLGLYGVDTLVSSHILKPEKFGGGINLFVIANFLDIFVYWLLLIVVFNKQDIEVIEDLKIPFLSSLGLLLISNTDHFPNWVCYILVLPASAIYLSYLTFKYNKIVFVDKIWKLEAQECVWIFNRDHTLILNATDNNTTTFFTWKYNHVTSTITISNDKEKRCYSVHTISSYRLILMRIPSLETLTFSSICYDTPKSSDQDSE